MQHDPRGLMVTLFLKEDEDDFTHLGKPQLHCPYCGDSFVHMRKPMYFAGGDDYDARSVFSMDVRGDVMVLSFSGECGHEWSLAFGFHKGHVFYDLIQKEGASE